MKFFEVDENGLHFWEREILPSVFGTSHATPNTMAELCRQLSFMLDAGVSFESAINAVEATTKDKRLKFALQRCLKSIMQGYSLSDALESAGYFAPFMCNMCRIGEMSDNLPKVMALLADYYEELSGNIEDIRSAMIYPAIVTVFMLFMILAAILFVLPQYALVFAASDVPLPLLTRALLGLSDTIISYWWLIVPGLMIVLFCLGAFINSRRGKGLVEYICLYLLPIRLVYRQMTNLHIVQAMALLLQSHLPLLDSVLAVAETSSNGIVAKDLHKLAAGLEEGKSFSSLTENISYIDPTIVTMARIGEETGNMAQSFTHASTYCRHKFKQLTMRLSKLVEPAITLVLGLVLVLVMLSIILPTFVMVDFVGY